MEHGTNPISDIARYSASVMRTGFTQLEHLPRRYSGFTLLEMLLTVFLIGLSVGLVALNVERNADDIAKLEARRFAALVSHLQDEATLTGLPMGIEVVKTDNRYRFWELDEKWQLIDRIQVLRERTVPESVSLELTLLQAKKTSSQGETDPQTQNSEETPKPKGPPKDLVIVDPTGLVGPFIATFRGEQTMFTISLDNELNPVISDEAI